MKPSLPGHWKLHFVWALSWSDDEISLFSKGGELDQSPFVICTYQVDRWLMQIKTPKIGDKNLIKP